ncbi:PIN domain-containing protein [Acidobacteria bacterium AH-259-L09]|nr:PIN domain-containing protein [Acidobacteria bacterium AH-259-L09]
MRGLEVVHKVITAIDQLPIQTRDSDREITFAAAHVKAHYAISYADAFAVALAQLRHGTIVTGDPEFEKVEKLVSIEWLSD